MNLINTGCIQTGHTGTRQHCHLTASRWLNRPPGLRSLSPLFSCLPCVCLVFLLALWLCTNPSVTVIHTRSTGSPSQRLFEFLCGPAINPTTRPGTILPFRQLRTAGLKLSWELCTHTVWRGGCNRE